LGGLIFLPCFTVCSRHKDIKKDAWSVFFYVITYYSAIRQDIGDMHGFDGVTLMPDISIQVHKAGKIGGNDIIGSRLQRVIHLLVSHRNRDRLEFHGKTATKAATGLHIVHFKQFQSFYLSEQLAGFFLDLTFP